jgi:lysophospholipase L1-like esterase
MTSIEAFRREVDLRREIVGRLAVEFGAVLVRTQDMFDEAARKTTVEYWLWDGVHPMPAGHELIARHG